VGRQILHASLKIGDTVLFASDAPPNHYSKLGGFSASLDVESAEEAERIFRELSAGVKYIWIFRRPSGLFASPCLATALESRG
jgi:uncharacterized glyoxalase superfamily protein PhnB